MNLDAGTYFKGGDPRMWSSHHYMTAPLQLWFASMHVSFGRFMLHLALWVLGNWLLKKGLIMELRSVYLNGMKSWGSGFSTLAQPWQTAQDGTSLVIMWFGMGHLDWFCERAWATWIEFAKGYWRCEHDCLMALGYKNHMHIAMPIPFLQFPHASNSWSIPELCWHNYNLVSEVASGFLEPPLLLAALAI